MDGERTYIAVHGGDGGIGRVQAGLRFAVSVVSRWMHRIDCFRAAISRPLTATVRLTAALLNGSRAVVQQITLAVCGTL